MARRSALADNDKRYGIEGAFLIEAGISSSYHIAKFFGLTDWMQAWPAEAASGGKAVERRPIVAALPTRAASRRLDPTRRSPGIKPVRQPKPAPHEPKRAASMSARSSPAR